MAPKSSSRKAPKHVDNEASASDTRGGQDTAARAKPDRSIKAHRKGTYEDTDEYAFFLSQQQKMINHQILPPQGYKPKNLPIVDWSRGFLAPDKDSSGMAAYGRFDEDVIAPSWQKFLDEEDYDYELPDLASLNISEEVEFAPALSVFLGELDIFQDEMTKEVTVKERLQADEAGSAAGDARMLGSDSTHPFRSLIEREISRPSFSKRIEQFLNLYQKAILDAFVDGARVGRSPLYAVSDEGRLVKTHSWASAIHPDSLEMQSYPGGEAQIMLIVLYTLLRHNPHLQSVFQALKQSSDLSDRRELLRKLGRSANTVSLPVLYTFHPAWPTDDELEPGTLLPAYIGQTQHGENRYRGHIRKAVNSRVAAASENVPLHQWEFDAIAIFDNSEFEVSSSVLLVCEHFLLSAFRATSLAKSGLNVNIVDRIRYEVLVPAKIVIKLLQGLNLVLERHPSQKLPVSADHWAWVTAVRSVLPSDLTAEASTVAQICCGHSRKYIWRMPQLKIDALRRYYGKGGILQEEGGGDQGEEDINEGIEGDEDDQNNRFSRVGTTPASIFHLRMIGRPLSNPRIKDSPIFALDTLRLRFEAAINELSEEDSGVLAGSVEEDEASGLGSGDELYEGGSSPLIEDDDVVEAVAATQSRLPPKHVIDLTLSSDADSDFEMQD